MILSRKFIKDYIDLDDNLSIQDIAEDMTRVGNVHLMQERVLLL